MNSSIHTGAESMAIMTAGGTAGALSTQLGPMWARATECIAELKCIFETLLLRYCSISKPMPKTMQAPQADMSATHMASLH